MELSIGVTFFLRYLYHWRTRSWFSHGFWHYTYKPVRGKVRRSAQLLDFAHFFGIAHAVASHVQVSVIDIGERRIDRMWIRPCNHYVLPNLPRILRLWSLAPYQKVERKLINILSMEAPSLWKYYFYLVSHFTS